MQAVSTARVRSTVDTLCSHPRRRTIITPCGARSPCQATGPEPERAARRRSESKTFLTRDPRPETPGSGPGSEAPQLAYVPLARTLFAAACTIHGRHAVLAPTPADNHHAVRCQISVPGYGAGSRTRGAAQVRVKDVSDPRPETRDARQRAQQRGPTARVRSACAHALCGSVHDPRSTRCARTHAGGRSSRRAVPDLRARLRGRSPNAWRGAGPSQGRF